MECISVGRERVRVGCGSMTVRLDCHRSLSWDVLAHYRVCCLGMEAVSYPPINLSVYPLSAESCPSLVQGAADRDIDTYPGLTDTPVYRWAAV